MYNDDIILVIVDRGFEVDFVHGVVIAYLDIGSWGLLCGFLGRDGVFTGRILRRVLAHVVPG